MPWSAHPDIYNLRLVIQQNFSNQSVHGPFTTTRLMKVLLFLFHLIWISKPSISKNHHLRNWAPNNMASLPRSICFLQWSDCLSAFFCIVDNSEAFSYTVIKDEFSSPIEKTPQFSYDRLYFIMRWKDITAGEKKSTASATHKRLSNIICFNVEAHCERNASVGFQMFRGLSVFSEQTTMEKW